jgi:hypothetical protein
MRILVFVRHEGYLRTFASTLDELAARGHQVEVALSSSIDGTPAGTPAAALLRDLERRHGGLLTSSLAPGPGDEAWERLDRAVRFSLDYLRYFDPPFRRAEKLRARAKKNAPDLVQQLAATRLGTTRIALSASRAILRSIERTVPPRASDVEFIANRRPDLLVVTPLLDGGGQTGYLRAGHHLGVRSGLCVSSWDNLTSKGLVHGDPDFVTLWNSEMAEEARTLHGIDPDRIVVTGAQVFDHWFSWRPSRSRLEFCEAVGLDPAQPFLLYACSSGLIAGKTEADYVDRWIARLRQRPELSDVGILVRPHPANLETWRDRELSDRRQTAVWRASESVPIGEDAKQDFYDSIFHSSGVVGINTSALIESAIVGRPVFTLVEDETRMTQVDTPHFALVASEGGLLNVAWSLAEHQDQLVTAVRNPGFDEGRRRRFLKKFVRPHGETVRATDVLVEVLEKQGTIATRPKTVSTLERLRRALITPLAKLAPESGRRRPKTRTAEAGGR